MPSTQFTNLLWTGPQNPDGKLVGSTKTDPIAFFGATPIVQPSGPNQAAASSGSAPGALTIYNSTQSPSSVVTLTTAEQSITVTGVLATDMVVINKLTSQAGLFEAMGRVSAANTVKLVFGNVTAGTLTPTGSQAYIVTTIPAALQLSAALTPAAVAANTIVEQQFSLTGVTPGQIVEVNKPTTQAGLAVLSSRAVAANVLGVTFANVTAGVLTPTAAETYEVLATVGFSSQSSIIEFNVSVGTLTGVAANTSSEQSVTAAGIQATDVMVGMTKPTTQAGLGLVSGRVSAASTIQVTFVNVTAGTLTPTASEVYGVTVYRPAPSAPATFTTTATLTPTAVAANTTAAQTFTVAGIVSGQPVMANPNYNISANAGVGIGNVRASATNTIEVEFVNVTAGSITPPAGTWTVAMISATTPTAGNNTSIPVTSTGSGTLGNALRSALVSLGLIAGA